MLRTHVLGTSVRGRPIRAYELDNPAPVILIIGCVHGDEPQSAFAAEALVELLQTSVGEMMDEHVFVVTCLNPDGLELATRKNANGVDLNRNFPTANWRRGDPQDMFYGGSMAGSEPETQVVLDLIRRQQPRRILVIHCIEPTRHCVNYDGPAQSLAELMAKSNGYPVVADIGHPTPGSLGTWIGYERKIPTVTLELPENLDAETCWQTNRNAIMDFIQAEFE